MSHVFDNGTRALSDIDLQIAKPQVVALLGPSGCGKSTLLRIVAGLVQPTSGRVLVGGDDGGAKHASKSSEMAFVFQDAHLLPWRTVLENVALPLELHHVPKGERNHRALEALRQVELQEWSEQRPEELSGGMKMRVSLARALVTQPALMLLDEPFAALDELTRHRLDEHLRKAALERDMICLFVTHSTSEAAFLADRAIVLGARPGRVTYDQPVELPRHRDAKLRGTTEFGEQVRRLYLALLGQQSS